MDSSLRQKAQSLWHLQRVKRLVRNRMGSAAQCLVTVRETMCTDPGCEGPMTEIHVVTLSFQKVRGLIHKPVSEIDEQDIFELF